jgi:hypothetical protein
MQTRNKSGGDLISKGPFRGHCHAPEEVPMTLQVALVGTDGIVLGSDRQKNFLPPDAGAVTTSSLVSKIFRNDSRGVMASWSGANPAIEVAKRVVAFPDNEIRSPKALEDLAKEVFEDESTKLGMEYPASEVLLVTKSDVTKIYQLIVQKQPACWPVLDKVIAGNSANVAVYFVQRFYRKLPMVELLPLVAHTILEGGRTNPGGIQGLEIVCCSEAGLEPVPDDKITELTDLSDRVESEIRRLLFPRA